MNRLCAACGGSEERGTWTRHLDFILATVAFTTGVRPISLFHLQYRDNGNDAFLIPYFFFMVLIGAPMLFMELSVGQLNSAGPIRSWRMVPIFRGVGVAMVVTTAITVSYSISSSALAFYYLFASFTKHLPWSECDPEWATDDCQSSDRSKDKCEESGYYYLGNGQCYDNVTGSGFGILDVYNLPSAVYLRNEVQRNPDGRDQDDLGPVVWHLALCSLLVWVVIALCLCKSVRSYGKASYFTTILPLCLMLTFFIYGLTLDGHSEAFQFFQQADMTEIRTNYRAWANAATSTFFSLGLCFGGLTTLGSYNRFNNNIFRDSVILWSIHILLTIIGSFMALFFVGAFATLYNQPLMDIYRMAGGYYLLFVLVPSLFLTTNAPVCWSILWFVMIVCFMIGRQLGFVETVVTAILDGWPNLRRLRPLVVIAVCSVLYLIGLPISTEGGSGLLYLLDYHIFSWNFYMIPIVQIVALLIYGIPRFLGDIEIMVGRTPFGYSGPVSHVKALASFFIVLPTLAAVLSYYVWYQMSYDMYEPEWKTWAKHFGHFLTWVIPVIIIVGVLFSVVYTAYTGKWRKDFCAFLSPPKDWGPVSLENRRKVLGYVPWFTVDPSPYGEIGSGITGPYDEIGSGTRLDVIAP